MNPILIAFLVVTAVGLAAGILIALISHFFGVEEDPRVKQIRECLPGINCGACVARCPAKAVDPETGKDHDKCAGRLDWSGVAYAPRYGCGKCQTAVPCESRNPSKP